MLRPRNAFEPLMCLPTEAKLPCILTSQSASSSMINAEVMFSLNIRDQILACARQQPSCAALSELLDSGRALGCISFPTTYHISKSGMHNGRLNERPEGGLHQVQE